MGQSPQFPQTPPQGDLFGSPKRKIRVPNPDKVRPRIVNFIAELRASDAMPWSPANLRLRREIVPRMIGYLPEKERAALLSQFEAQIARLAEETLKTS